MTTRNTRSPNGSRTFFVAAGFRRGLDTVDVVGVLIAIVHSR
ncbi:hypothetical protein [Micromonospora sp. ATA51]|nr:hypothetical protein [Micromonospora sp. ATA51]